MDDSEDVDGLFCIGVLLVGSAGNSFLSNVMLTGVNFLRRGGFMCCGVVAERLDVVVG